jgi:monothiol glutaredoxin
MTDNNIQEQIKTMLEEKEIVLFMKGDKDAPQCGFSNVVVKILQLHEVDFHVIDVLQNDELRQGIKDFSNWPTIPQLYVKGEFIGGCDIVKELYESRELAKILVK